MNPGIIFAIVLLSLLATGGAVFFIVQERQRLAAIGELLGGGSNFSSAWGSALGVRATLRWQRKDRDNRQPWTEITAELPANLPFVMALRPQGWLERRSIDRGKLVDVVVGDGAFDAAYVIEAAPADVVRELLTPARRAALAGYGKIELVTQAGPPPRLRLRIPAVLDEPHAAKPALQLAVDLATGVRQAYAAVEAAVAAQRVGAPFREQLIAIDDQEAAQRRVDEVRQLEGKRTLGLAAMVLFSIVLWLVALVGLFWAARRW